MEFKMVEIEKIKPNTYNPNEMTERVFDHLKAEIARIGFLDPVLVREENGEYIIVDGEHRWTASKEAGLKTIPVVIVEMTETEAMIETYNANAIKGLINPLKFANLIEDLKTNIQMEDLSKYLNIDMTILEGYSMLLQMPEGTEYDYSVLKDAKNLEFELIKIFLNIENARIFEEALNATKEKTIEKQFLTMIKRWVEKNDKRNTEQ